MSSFGQPPGGGGFGQPPGGGPPPGGGGFGQPPGGTPPPGGGGFGQPPGGTPPPGGGGFGQPPGGGGFGQPPGSAPGGSPGFGQPPGGPPNAFGGAPPGGGGGGAPQTDPMAIGSLAIGAFSLITCFCCVGFFGPLGWLSLPLQIIGIGIGGFSLKRQGDEPDKYGGKPVAIAGIVTSTISLILALVIGILRIVGALAFMGTQGGGY